MSVILLLDENGEDITNEQLYCVEPDCLGDPWCTAWGICSENISKNLEIHQEEPTTSENIPATSLKLTSFLRKLRSHRWSPSPMFLMEILVFLMFLKVTQNQRNVLHQPKTTREIELHRRNSMAKKTREDMEYCLRIGTNGGNVGMNSQK